MKFEYVISVATKSELNEISRLVNSAYRGKSSRKGWTTEADFLDGQRTDSKTLLSEVTKSGRTILCLRKTPEGPLLGCVSLELLNDKKSYYLGMLTVKPDIQNGGIGRNLLAHSEEFARKKGGTRMILGVIQLRTALIAWYERRGYKKTGETKPFPYGDEKAGLPIRNDLYFVMFEKNLS